MLAAAALKLGGLSTVLTCYAETVSEVVVSERPAMPAVSSRGARLRVCG